MKDPKNKSTRIPVTAPELCEDISTRWGWNQKEDPEYTGIDGLPWNCIFEGDVSYPAPPHEANGDD